MFETASETWFRPSSLIGGFGVCALVPDATSAAGMDISSSRRVRRLLMTASPRNEVGLSAFDIERQVVPSPGSSRPRSGARRPDVFGRLSYRGFACHSLPYGW